MKEKANEFYELSNSFCNYIINNIVEDNSLKYIIEELMKIYLLAINLPNVNIKESEENKQYKYKIYEETDIKVSKKTNISYWNVLTPLYNPPLEDEPVQSILRNDLKEIIEDLLYGNVLYEKGKIDDAVHEWKNSCFMHWGGNHAMGLFSAIHAKLSYNYLHENSNK